MSTIKVNEVKHQSTADGGVELYNNGDVAIPEGAKVRFDEGTSSGTPNYVSFNAPVSLSADYNYTLPTATPAVSGYVLASDTSGTLSWVELPEGGEPNAILTNQAATKTAGNVTFNDNVQLHFGTGNDVDFFCNGSHMYMDLNSGIDNFYIRDGTTTRFTFDDNGTLTASVFNNSGVRQGYKSSTAGQVGTVAFLGLRNNGSDRGKNYTKSGSNLMYSNANGNESGTPSGSWRLLGRLAGSGSSSTADAAASETSVWIRYA